MDIRTKKQSPFSQGFTVSELLIVVAIIGVLVAIAVPIFSSQLENTRNETDAANAKMYADALSIYYLTNPDMMEKLEAECAKPGSLHCVIMSVGQKNANANATYIRPALVAAGLCSAKGAITNIRCQSQTPWKGYQIALYFEDGKFKVGYRGNTDGGSTGRPSSKFSTEADPTGFRYLLTGGSAD